MKIVIEPNRKMGPFIALHGLLPKSELRGFHHRIPRNEIWIRKDVYENKARYPWIKLHELYEVDMMSQGLKYKEAHRRAEIVDGLW